METKQTEPPSHFLSMKEAAKVCGVTRQAIHLNIRSGKIPAVRNHHNHYRIDPKDLEGFEPNKHKPKPKYTDYYSVLDAAKVLNLNFYHIYYMVRKGKLKAYRKGAGVLVLKKSVEKYQREVCDKRTDTTSVHR